MDCGKCLQLVETNAQPFVYCNGMCGRVFHATCVGVEIDDLPAVSPPKRNSFWLCDECFDEFLQWRETHKKSPPQIQTSRAPECDLHRDVEVLKAKVEAIMTTLSANIASPPDNAIRHSTPVSSLQIDCGSREISSQCETSSSPNQTERFTNALNGDDRDDSFALMLTNIDCNVTEEDVQQMVSRCLGARYAECNNVRKLVPRWIDCSNLDYISFKVVLSRKWKPAAMTSSTWPKNVKFREFKRRQTTWKPSDL
ncbi:uncharacterized protein LOC134286241 [Aedes albopictus]|uniref:PHD-type domain-containing protein n=1 Tax=Aedes albopictus TaxID=7160 RepID=A0ABM2A441_AEDAL